MIELASWEQQHGWLKGVAGTLIVLNMLDGVLTIAWINFGRATEINPLMDVLISTHPVLFIAIKMLLVCLGVSLLWRYRTQTPAIVSIYLCCMAYTFVLLYHLGGGVIS